MNCAVCGKVADPAIYESGFTVVGGEFGRCPKCGKVYCNKCSTVEWMDKNHEWGVNTCPVDNAHLKDVGLGGMG